MIFSRHVFVDPIRMQSLQLKGSLGGDFFVFVAFPHFFI